MQRIAIATVELRHEARWWSPDFACHVPTRTRLREQYVAQLARNWYLLGQWGDATFAHEAGHFLGLGDYGPGIMGRNLTVPVNEQNIKDILTAGNEVIRHGCGCN